MRNITLISAAVISAGTLMAGQTAFAYEAGDRLVRIGVAQTDTGSGNGNVGDASLNVQSARGLTFGAGYLFSDKVGMELNSSEKFEHDLDITPGGDAGSVDRLPVNFIINYYPLGGLNSHVQPYVGAGVNYTRFSGEPAGLRIDESYGLVGQAGIDLAVTRNMMLNGFINYADVSADIDANGDTIGKVNIDPVTVGGGVTYRF